MNNEKELIILLYKTIAMPHLEYIQKLRNISYEMRLKECGLTLENRRLRRDQIKVFKVLNVYENTEIFFFRLRKGGLRGLGVIIANKQRRLDIRKFSFSQRTVNEWNRLSADCVGTAVLVVLICLKIN